METAMASSMATEYISTSPLVTNPFLRLGMPKKSNEQSP